jgi:hypothetical protein
MAVLQMNAHYPKAAVGPIGNFSLLLKGKGIGTGKMHGTTFNELNDHVGVVTR